MASMRSRILDELAIDNAAGCEMPLANRATLIRFSA
jgi:hypothetical protein